MNYFSYGIVATNTNKNSLLQQGLQLIQDEAFVNGKLFDTGLGFPAVALGEGTVKGKLFVVESEAMHTLLGMAERFDLLNPPYRFVLRPIVVNTPAGHYEAQTFIYESAGSMTEIKSGAWV